MPDPKPCRRQQELIGDVQRHLIQLSDLARAEAEVIKSDSENAWLAVDEQIERTLGAKERAMGALRQHRDEHGC